MTTLQKITVACWVGGWLAIVAGGALAAAWLWPAAIVSAGLGLGLLAVGGVGPLLSLSWHGVEATVNAGEAPPAPATTTAPRIRVQRGVKR